MYFVLYSSTCHERTPSGPGKSVRTLQVPLIRGTDGHVEMSRDIDNMAVHSRWPLTRGRPRQVLLYTIKFIFQSFSYLLVRFHSNGSYEIPYLTFEDRFLLHTRPKLGIQVFVCKSLCLKSAPTRPAGNLRFLVASTANGKKITHQCVVITLSIKYIKLHIEAICEWC